MTQKGTTDEMQKQLTETGRSKSEAMRLPAARAKKEVDHEVPVIEITMAFWQSRDSRRLNAENARQMIENISGFFAQLDDWDRHDAAEVDIRPRNVNLAEIPSSSPQPSKEFAKEHRLCNQVPDSFAA